MNAIEYHLPEPVTKAVEARLTKWEIEHIPARVWQKDPSVWKAKPEEQNELSNRLGWLNLPAEMAAAVEVLQSFAKEAKEKFSQVLLLGMGGSSLAPEVFARTFGSSAGYPQLCILDSTHPAVVKHYLTTLELEKTLFVVSSKSGSTIETATFLHTFFAALEQSGLKAGDHFIALTDPGSSLEKLAVEKDFLRVFSTPPEVGGRYSALTEFGLLPAALIGMDIEMFLAEAESIADNCTAQTEPAKNPGFYLGAVLGELALRGIDKVTYYAAQEIASFPSWIEQLVAESTGKEGVGIVPIADEPWAGIEQYGNDRVFVFLKVGGPERNEIEQELINAGKPVISVTVNNLYALAQEFYRWEFATAAAGITLGINPFDQPDVQLAKTLAGEALKAYNTTGILPQEKPALRVGALDFYGTVTGTNAKEVLTAFLAGIAESDYIGILSFIPYAEATDNALLDFRVHLLTKYKCAVTSGYGPRFLHSTGQLHKGGKNNGVFIQITNLVDDDVQAPGQGYSFATLLTAQASGDANALISRGRRLLKIRVRGDIAAGIRELVH
jgi:glucose-6-phosphate isomerase